MAIIEIPRGGKQIIHLDSIYGNAFTLIGEARNLAKQLGWDKAKIEAMQAEMMAGDYEALLQCFDRHFGMVVDLVRSKVDRDDDEDYCEECDRVYEDCSCNI